MLRISESADLHLGSLDQGRQHGCRARSGSFRSRHESWRLADGAGPALAFRSAVLPTNDLFTNGGFRPGRTPRRPARRRHAPERHRAARRQRQGSRTRRQLPLLDGRRRAPGQLFRNPAAVVRGARVSSSDRGTARTVSSRSTNSARRLSRSRRRSTSRSIRAHERPDRSRHEPAGPQQQLERRIFLEHNPGPRLRPES